MCAVCWHSLWRASWLGPVMCALTATLPSAELVGLCHVVGALQATPTAAWATGGRGRERVLCPAGQVCVCLRCLSCPFACAATELLAAPRVPIQSTPRVRRARPCRVVCVYRVCVERGLAGHAKGGKSWN